MKEKIQAFGKRIKKGFERMGGFLKKWEMPIAFALVGVLAMALRISLFDARAGDYNAFLSKWFDTIQSNGGFAALGMTLGDYTAPYYYILTLLTYLPIPSLYSIKAVSCIFDVVLAVFVARIVWEFFNNKTASLLVYTITLFLPTVFLNSGSWGQCDSIYVSFCVMSLYYLLKDKKYTAIILYGVAFSFKLQAIFLAPLLAVLWFKRKIPLLSPLIIVGVYFVFCIPSWIAGRDLWSLLTVYFMQAGEYASRLNLNAPAFAAMLGTLDEGWTALLSKMLVVLALSLTVIAMYFCARKTEWSKRTYLHFGLLFALGVPFFLPHMHERYFYLADILALLYAFLHPKRAYTALLTEFCSFYAVGEYLWNMPFFTLGFIAFLQGVNLLLLVRDLWKDYGKPLTGTPLTGLDGERV